MRAFARAAVVVSILGSCCTWVVAIPITAAVYNGGGTLSNWHNATGYHFTANTDIFVLALGVYDHGASGFISPHEVGIFEMDGTAVATASLPSGFSGTLIDGTRFVDLDSPVMLMGGTEYYILSDNFGQDDFVYGSGAVTYAAEITWNGFTDATSNSIYASVSHWDGVPGNLGPNFRLDTEPATVIPEPASLTLLALGGLGLLSRRRRNRS